MGALKIRGRFKRLRVHNLHVNWRRYHAKKQRGFCALCGRPMGEDITLDHIIPMSQGGADTFDNTQAAHQECNWKKGNVPPGDME